MHPCRVTVRPATGMRRTGLGTRFSWSPILLDHVVAMKTTPWLYQPLFDRAAFPIRVVHVRWAGPISCWEKYRGPAVSFSEGGGKVWAALCGDGSDIGIDVAAADEFQGEYPLHRVFHDQELHHAGRLTGGDAAKRQRPCSGRSRKRWSRPWDARSILWPAASACLSIKRRELGGIRSPVSLSGKALVRYPLAPAGPYGCVRFPLEGRCGFPSPL
jgi:hypothetical protein